MRHQAPQAPLCGRPGTGKAACMPLITELAATSNPGPMSPRLHPTRLPSLLVAYDDAPDDEKRAIGALARGFMKICTS